MGKQLGKTKRTGAARKRPTGEPAWVTASNEKLLQMRVCDLGIQFKGSGLEKRVAQLHKELEARGLRFRPHCWLSDEWFSQDGVPGIAVPFYLAHPRLKRLERQQMFEVEGGTTDWCMRILRHEAGHAIDTAYRLHLRRCWRELFGKYSKPYPEFYQPRPYSRRYVLHLDLWYAQSHPSEDFAETFAVWLKSRPSWRKQYRGWPALKKLEYMDELMQEIKGKTAPVRSRRHVYPLREMCKTLGEYYAEKREHYGLDYTNFYDRDLLRLFSNLPEHANNLAAATFLRRTRGELRRVVSQWTGEYQYTINAVLAEMIERCEELKLRVNNPDDVTKRDAMVILTVQIMNYLHEGWHRLAL